MDDEIILHSVIDAERGNLYMGEAEKQIPFSIRRFYVIRGIPDFEDVRGQHAHKTLEQVIFCLNGSFELHMDDGQKKWNIVMDDPSKGIRFRKMVWHSMTNFSKDCIILVVASEYHDESDYIRNYNDFLKYISEFNI